MSHRKQQIIGAALVTAFVLTACGNPAGSPPPGAAPGASTPAAAVFTGGEGGGEAGGVEAALVTYADTAQKFAIGHPGTWTQDPAVTAGVKFVGGDDSLTLTFVKPAAGDDLMAYAKADVAAVSTAFPGFKQLSLASSSEVAGAVILGFEADGTSAVTGKTFRAHNERYYLPVADGRIAVLTVVGPSAHYDREGVRDIALTFKVAH